MKRRHTSVRAESTFLTDQFLPIRGYLTGTRKDEDISYPVRYFVTGPNSPLTAGQMVTSPVGEEFLLGNHTRRGHEVSFRAIPTTDKLTWERAVEIKDPVSKMVRDTQMDALGTIRTTLEPMSSEKDGLRIPNARFSFYTGEDVQEGDTIAGMQVSQVTPVIGLNLVVLT